MFRYRGRTIPRPATINQIGVFMSIFTDRELEIFELLGQGFRTTQIAKKLHVSTKTVHAYCARMREKMSLGSSRELLREAFRWNESNG